MRARKYRPINEVGVPVRGTPSTEVPNKPGLFAGKQRREDYQQALEDLAKEEELLSQRYARDMDAMARQNQANEIKATGNRRAAERRQMMRDMPEVVKNNPYAQVLGDRVVDARHLGQQIAAAPGQVHPGYYAGAAGLVGSAGLLNAYSQLQQDEMDRGVIPTTARATSNLLGGIGAIGGSGVGTDPLAMARNGVRDASDALNSPRMLEAMVLDQMEGVQTEEAVANVEFENEVTRLAEYLLTVPSRNAEGSTIYMSARDAYSQARQIIELDQAY